MSEQKEQKDKKIKSRLGVEKRFYILAGAFCAITLSAVIAVAVILSGGDKTGDNQNVDNNQGNQTITPPNPDNNEGTDEPVIITPEGMVMPIPSVSVSNDYGFYYNQSVNAYYRHEGVDFSAEVGTEVVAVDSGIIESIYKDELLTGTEIVIDHGDGIKSVYRFVKEIDGLKAGDTVEKGEVIATVAEACGNEHKDGPHLHLEIIENGKNVDPSVHLTLEEK